MRLSNNKRSMLLCAVLGITVEIAAGLILAWILSFFPETATGYQGQMDSHLSNGLISLLFVIIISPVFEEAVFRFMLLGVLEIKIGFYAANVVQAAIFGLYHMSLIQGIYAFLLGMLIGFLKHYTGTVLGCVCFHIAFNMTGTLVNKLVPAEINTGIRIPAMILTLAVSVALFVLIRKNRCDAQTA